MKKELLALLVSAVSVQTSFAYVNLNASSNSASPTLFSTSASTWANVTAGHEEFLYKGTGTSGATWLNSYVTVDTSVSNYTHMLISGSGGYHNNLYMTFRNTTMAYSSTESTLISYNGSYYSMAVYYQAADGMTGTINATNATGITFDLATNDATFNNATVYGLKGRVVSVGSGITYNVTGAFTLKGRLTTTQTTYTDSEFIVNGALNVGGTAYIQGSNLSVGGVFTATGGVQTTPYTTAINSVNVTFASDILVKAGGTLKTPTLALRGGTATINGTLVGLDGSSAIAFKFGFEGTGSSTVSNLTIGDLASVNIGAITADNGTLNLNSSLTAASLTSTASYTSAINVASGKTLSLASATINGNTTFGGAGATSVSGILQNTGTTTINAGTVVNVGSASLNDTVLNNSGSLVVKGTLNVNSARSNWYQTSSIAGNITINGGTVVDNTSGSYAASMQLDSGKTMSITNGGSLQLASNLYLLMQGGSLTVDSLSSVNVTNFQFAAGTTSRVTLNDASNLITRSNIFISGPAGSTNSTKVIFNLAADESYSLGKIQFLRYSVFTLNLNGATEVVFSAVERFATASDAIGTLNIYDFKNGVVKIENITSTSQIYDGNKILLGSTAGTTQVLSLYAYDDEGNPIEDVTWEIDDFGYLAIVPEPAAWAAIFGAIALFFAVRRRRK